MKQTSIYCGVSHMFPIFPLFSYGVALKPPFIVVCPIHDFPMIFPWKHVSSGISHDSRRVSQRNLGGHHRRLLLSLVPECHLDRRRKGWGYLVGKMGISQAIRNLRLVGPSWTPKGFKNQPFPHWEPPCAKARVPFCRGLTGSSKSPWQVTNMMPLACASIYFSYRRNMVISVISDQIILHHIAKLPVLSY